MGTDSQDSDGSDLFSREILPCVEGGLASGLATPDIPTDAAELGAAGISSLDPARAEVIPTPSRLAPRGADTFLPLPLEKERPSMTHRLLAIVRALALPLLGALLLAAPTAAQQYVQLPGGSWATDVTPDGSIVVGSWNGGSFIWRWRIDPAPTFIPGGSVVGVSDDGSVLAGNVTNPSVNAQEAAIFTGGQFVNGVYQGGSWTGLGWFPGALGCPSYSTAYGISGDGKAVVGLSWNGCTAYGFKWTQAAGMVPLQFLANDHNRCTAISADGSTLGGFAQGLYERTPAYWDSSTLGFVLNPAYLGEVYNFTKNGSLSVGTFIFGSNNYYDAFLRDKQSGQMTNLGHLNAGWSAHGHDLSEDGKTVVGFDSLQLARQAWVWKQGEGIVSLNQRLANLGIANVPPLTVALACSDDGNVVVGGLNLAVNPWSAGYIVDLSPMSPYGLGTPGCTGPEILTGTLPPKVGEANFTLACTKAPAYNVGLAIVTNAPDLLGSDPFAIGALLHVDLFSSTETNTLDLFSDGQGLGTAAAPIPNNPIIVGSTYYAQAIWAWPMSVCNNAPFGISSSNGLAIKIQP